MEFEKEDVMYDPPKNIFNDQWEQYRATIVWIMRIICVALLVWAITRGRG